MNGAAKTRRRRRRKESVWLSKGIVELPHNCHAVREDPGKFVRVHMCVCVRVCVGMDGRVLTAADKQTDPCLNPLNQG